jgi:hypothetical protein
MEAVSEAYLLSKAHVSWNLGAGLLPRMVKLVILACVGTVALVTLAQEAAPPQRADAQTTLHVCPMHPDVQSQSAGTCPRCRMALTKVNNPSGTASYSCFRHTDVKSMTPGVCPRCAAELSRRFTPAEYKVELITTPEKVQAGKQATLRFRIFDPSTGDAVRDLDIVHEKPFHLFVISQDLAEFQHIHPILQSDGSFVVETVLPRAGRYEVVCDFAPMGGWPQVVRRSLVTAEATGSTRSIRPNLVPDGKLSKVVEQTRFNLSFETIHPIAGTPISLDYSVTDENTGAPVKDLQPYLGAWGHTVVLSEDATDFVHLHPTGAVPPQNAHRPITGGPDVSFSAFFPKPGRYRVWSQFQRQGKVLTTSFDVDALQQDPIAVWDGHKWAPLSPTPFSTYNTVVNTFALNGADVYVAVKSTNSDSTYLNRVIKWDGHSWSSLGEGFNGSVWTLAVRSNEVYAGGSFTTAGGMAATGIARWDGYKWTAIGGGVDGCRDSGCSPGVYALEIKGRDVYVGGRFTKAGGIQTNGIAKWNGERWSRFDTGVQTGIYDGVVRAIAVRGGSVYVGGTFKTAGDSTVNNIAEWDGSQWSPLGAGIRGGLEQVLALGAIEAGKLFVGGNFNTAGSVQASNAALWDGHSWSTLGLGTNREVSTIAVDGNVVYLGGSSFTLPSGQEARGAIRWDSRWSGLGEGLLTGGFLPQVRTLRISEKRAIAAGDPFVFRTADTPVPR